jgi:hypothetical protein
MSERVAIRSAWNESLMILKGPLTDRAIDRYQRQGWYSAEMKQARKERQEKKEARRARAQKREGAFLVMNDGRKVYSPL